MLSFAIAGLAVGALYAMSAMALVITYNASRVFNFAQGGMAFFLAYCFYYMGNSDTGLGWNLWLSAAIVVLIIGPLLGLFLWWLLVRLVGRTASNPTANQQPRRVKHALSGNRTRGLVTENLAEIEHLMRSFRASGETSASVTL